MNGWQGVDGDIETSLFEYDFVAKQLDNRDYPDEWYVFYRIHDNAYGHGYIRESDLDNLVNGKRWMDEEEIQSFLKLMDYDNKKEEWLELLFVFKLSDILRYWGHENIMGTEYYPLNKEEALLKLHEKDTE
jgi:hypothetical protein